MPAPTPEATLLLPEAPAAAAVASSADEGGRKHVRGSSLLLAGRVLSAAINFAVQLLIVRHLSTSAYGAWAYGLSVVALCQALATLGLDRTSSRFIPIYYERGEHQKLLGTIALVLGASTAAALIVVAAVLGFPHQVAAITRGESADALLLLMIFLVPAGTLDNVLLALFASFDDARAIFFRKYVVGPGLKLAVVLLLVAFESSVRFLALGYLAASFAGVLLYLWLLAARLKSLSLLKGVKLSTLKAPTREIVAFTMPLITTDMANLINNCLGSILLAYFHGVGEVAFYRVVLPMAEVNKLVFSTFATLYVPSAARLFARNNQAGINALYWRTAAWIGILSFPIFAMTFSFADPVITFLYGERYARSAMVLSLLALAGYFNVALGCNRLTLEVLGRVRYLITINAFTAVSCVALNLLLIPRYGALGAAAATAGTIVIQNVLMQTGLKLAAGIRFINFEYLWFYLLAVALAAMMFAVERYTSANIVFAVVLTGVLSLLMLFIGRGKLNLAETFPESLRIPVLRKFFA